MTSVNEDRTGANEARPEDLVAALAAMVLIRSGCDHLPVDIRYLLRKTASIRVWTNQSGIVKDRGRYTVLVPASDLPEATRCCNLLLDVLLDSLGIMIADEPKKQRLQSIFACHLLCPRPIFRITGRTWCSIAFLEEDLGLPRQILQDLSRCPSCYVPKELNNCLLQQLRRHRGSIGRKGEMKEVDLRHYLLGYEDEEEPLKNRPVFSTGSLQETVDAIIPEGILTKEEPELFIAYTEDFEAFFHQFFRLDLAQLYRVALEEDPPLPLFGGKPQKDDKDYATRMERYLYRVSTARLAMAHLFYQRKYHPEQDAGLEVSIRKLYAAK